MLFALTELKSQQPLSRSPLSNGNSPSLSLPPSAASSPNLSYSSSPSRPNSIFTHNRLNSNPAQNLSRPMSTYSNMSRPISVHSAGKGNSRPPSVWRYAPPEDSSESSGDESDDDDDEESEDEQLSGSDVGNQGRVSEKKPNGKSSLNGNVRTGAPISKPPILLPPKGYKPPSSNSSPTRTSPTQTSPTRSSPTRSSPNRSSPTRSLTKSPESGEDDVNVHTPTSVSVLEKVDEEKSDEESDDEKSVEENSDEESDEGSDEESEEESEEEEEEDSGEESEDSDTPLALKMNDATPRILLQSAAKKKSPRVEAWDSDGKCFTTYKK
jgi:hypothetical protein